MLDATRDLVLPTTIKSMAITLGANIVRRELRLPDAPVPAADPRFA